MKVVIVSDLFGGTDPRPMSVTVVTSFDPSSSSYKVTLTVAESSSRRRHTATVEQIPVELLADVLDNTSWWVNLAWSSVLGQHRSVPRKWARRQDGRVAGWRRRES